MVFASDDMGAGFEKVAIGYPVAHNRIFNLKLTDQTGRREYGPPR